jgi:hypothetical protein
VVQNVLLVLSGDHPAKPALSHFPCADFNVLFQNGSWEIPHNENQFLFDLLADI